MTFGKIGRKSCKRDISFSTSFKSHFLPGKASNNSLKFLKTKT